MGLKSIKSNYVLLCEGMHDAQFFSYLISQRSLPRFEISSCGNVLDSPRRGIDSLTDALDELPTFPGFQNVEAILIVADNDDDPTAAFTKVTEMINATADILGFPNRRYVAPSAPGTKAGTNPVIVVMMIPQMNVPGNLDTMCLTAAANNAPSIGACVDAFATCTGANTWPSSKLGKMKLRSLISGSHRDDPHLSPAWVWREGTSLVPLSDPVFNDVALFLRDFPTLLSSP